MDHTILCTPDYYTILCNDIWMHIQINLREANQVTSVKFPQILHVVEIELEIAPSSSPFVSFLSPNSVSIA